MRERISEKPWYKQWWAIVAFVLLGLCVLFTLAFLFLFGRYFFLAQRQMKLNEEFAKTQSVDRTLVETADDPFIGYENAPVVIVAFSDFSCAYCRQEYYVLEQVLKKYKNQVKFIFRDFPIAQPDDPAFQAALAGNCAHEQGKFWPYYQALFTTKEALGEQTFVRLAKHVGVKEDTFRQCLGGARFQAEVEQDLYDGVDAGVEGTPSFFINGFRVQGAIPAQNWDEIIQSFLKFAQ